jgi:hypothetical protein
MTTPKTSKRLAKFRGGEPPERAYAPENRQAELQSLRRRIAGLLEAISEFRAEMPAVTRETATATDIVTACAIEHARAHVLNVTLSMMSLEAALEEFDDHVSPFDGGLEPVSKERRDAYLGPEDEGDQ